MVSLPVITGTGAGKEFIVTEALPEQPLESVTVTVYVPGVDTEMLCVVCPFDHKQVVYEPTSNVPLVAPQIGVVVMVGVKFVDVFIV
jgi:hypothetical protein